MVGFDFSDTLSLSVISINLRRRFDLFACAFLTGFIFDFIIPANGCANLFCENEVIFHGPRICRLCHSCSICAAIIFGILGQTL